MNRFASEVQQIVPGAYYWEMFCKESKIDLSCASWRFEEEVVLIDPMPLAMAAMSRVVGNAGRAVVLLTNGNHERQSDWFRQKMRLPVMAHQEAAPELKKQPERCFQNGSLLPAGLQAIHLPGAGAGESAFYTPAHGGIVFMGDALVNMDSLGGLAFLPEKYALDPVQSRASMRKLLSLEFQIMTFAHGKPIVSDAKKKLAALLGDS